MDEMTLTFSANGTVFRFLTFLLGSSVFTRTCLRYVRVFAIANPSDCLSFACDVRAPYSGGWRFRQYFFTAVYLRAKFYGDHPRGTLPSEALNATDVAKWSDVGLDLLPYKIRPRVQLMTNRKWHVKNSLCNFQWPWPIRNPYCKVIGVFCRQ